MAAALQAFVLAACSMILISICSAQLAELGASPPPGSGTASAQLHRIPSSALYTMNFRIGKTEVSAVIDTGSDLIWTSNSQLFESPVSCPFKEGEEMGSMNCCHNLATFERQYGGIGGTDDATFLRGVMGGANLRYLGEPIDPPQALYLGSAITFGCQKQSSEFDGNGLGKDACNAYHNGGIVGLGRGKLSLVTQLKFRSFSYCLPDRPSSSSSSDADQKATGLIQFYGESAHPPLKDGMTTINLVKLDSAQAKYPKNARYYVKLKQIGIGGSTVSIWEAPQHCTSSTEGGSGDGGMMIIDSGSPMTTLPKKAVDAIMVHLNKIIKADPKEIQGFFCYTAKRPATMDDIVLEFTDEKAQMAIPADNYLFETATGQLCVGITSTKDDEECGMSILGAYQQQGMKMLFDIQRNTLSFAKHGGACGAQSAQQVNRATM